jgi:adenylate kinase
MADNELTRRIMDLSEEQVEKTHNVEQPFLRRLTKYRQNNASHRFDTPRSFFEVVGGVKSVDIPLTPTINDKKVVSSLQVAFDGTGKLFNFHPTDEEILAAQIALEQVDREAKAAVAAEQEAKVKEEANIRAANHTYKVNTLKELQKGEDDLLESRSRPLTEYLLKEVMPTLNAGLEEVKRAKPEDPVEFLAEWLFLNNKNSK